jgi:hypothetical protein
MKYLKKFENFDLGRFGQEHEEEENIAKLNLEEEEEDCAPCNDEEVDEIPGGEWEEEEEEEQEEQEENRIRRWGDEVVEKKKVNAGFQAYLDKQKAKKGDKKEEKEEKGGKKSKPDFLDLDKDGDKKESMKKAAKDAKDDKKEEKGGKGLTAAQKKLPEAMQKAILKKQK